MLDDLLFSHHTEVLKTDLRSRWIICYFYPWNTISKIVQIRALDYIENFIFMKYYTRLPQERGGGGNQTLGAAEKVFFSESNSIFPIF